MTKPGTILFLSYHGCYLAIDPLPRVFLGTRKILWVHHRKRTGATDELARLGLKLSKVVSEPEEWK